MLLLRANTPILLATQPVDFRRGIDGLAAICRQQLQQEPRSGTFFVFINRSQTMIRALVYDNTGFWLMTKRLSQGHFRDWPRTQAAVSTALATQLRALLAGQQHWQRGPLEE